MHISAKPHLIAKLAAKGPITESEFRTALPDAMQGTGLSELIKGFMVEVISVPLLQERRTKFNSKINADYKGPIVVAEGDSWFLYPIKLVDVIGQLNGNIAIWDEALPGDTTERMLDFSDSLVAQIAYLQPDVLLFSGGGNDLLGSGRLAELLEPGDLPDPKDYLGPRMRAEMVSVMGRYATILAKVRTVIPGLPMIIHGYDYAIPRPNGTWLGAPMDRLGISSDIVKRQAIVRAIIDDFHRRLSEFANTNADVVHVDLRGTVPGHLWFDELHPDTDGFALVSKKIGAAISSIKPLVA
jgi:hypothetical protein